MGDKIDPNPTALAFLKKSRHEKLPFVLDIINLSFQIDIPEMKRYLFSSFNSIIVEINDDMFRLSHDQ
jgi:hypothetical protein